MKDRYQFAQEIVQKAGEYILREFKRKKFKVREKKKNQDDFVTEIDENCEKFLTSHIKEHFPDDGIVGEEGSRTTKTKSPYLWLIDPIDGTSSFVRGLKDFAVQIGILYNNKPIIGVVYAPLHEKFYHAKKDQGAFCNDTPMAVSTHKTLKSIKAVSSIRIFREIELQKMYAKVPYTVHYFMGSMGCKMAAIAEGRFDLLFSKKHGVSEWDIAGPQVILEEAGGKITFADGSKIIYNNSNPQFKKGIIITNGTCHNLILKYFK